MMFDEVLKLRKATRNFKNTKIAKDVLNKILEDSTLAPTAKNYQPQLIYVIESSTGLAKIDKASPCRYNAPVVLLICSDKSKAWHNQDDSTYEMDATIVATYLMLAATNMKVDSVWVKMFDKKIIKEEFSLDENIEPICLLPLGYAIDNYEPSSMHYYRKSLSEIVEYR